MTEREYRRRRTLVDRVLDTLPIIGILIGLVMLAYPVYLDWKATQATRVEISKVTSAVDESDDPDRLAILGRAQRWNESIAAKAGAEKDNDDNTGMAGSNEDAGDIPYRADMADENDVDTEEDVDSAGADSAEAGYEDQLTWKNSSMIGWLEIPKIDLTMSIYHGSSDEVLAEGVGHLEASSLPVGGKTSHCVLMAHSGLMTSRMFDELHKVEPGDKFSIHVLGDVYVYQVVEEEVVKPEEALEHLDVVPGKDLCTLMTCTPYGVNTDRLLVHAKRVPYTGARSMQAPVTRLVNMRTVPLGTMLFVVLCAILVSYKIGRSTGGRASQQKDQRGMSMTRWD